MWVGEKKTSVKVQVVNAEKADDEDQLADANSLAINTSSKPIRGFV